MIETYVIVMLVMSLMLLGKWADSKGWLLIAICLTILPGCTDNMRAKSFGGSVSIKLPADQKLVNATWKESELWYLTRPMRDEETAETLTFQEKSSFGMVEGSVQFHESRGE